MSTARKGIAIHVLMILLFAFLIGMILPFGLMQGDNASELLFTRMMAGFFAPFMLAYLGRNVLSGIVAGSLFLVIGVLLTLYIGGIITSILSLRARMALVFAILLASLWDILVLADCLLHNLAVQ